MYRDEIGGDARCGLVAGGSSAPGDFMVFPGKLTGGHCEGGVHRSCREAESRGIRALGPQARTYQEQGGKYEEEMGGDCPIPLYGVVMRLHSRNKR